MRLGAELLVSEFKGREKEVSTILTFADRDPTKEEILSAWFRRDQLRLRLAEKMAKVQVLLCPVCSVPAFRHGEREWSIADKQVTYMDAMAYTQWFNLMGAPAAVVPVGKSNNDLPIGVQIAARPYQDEVVLAIAEMLDFDFGYKAPPMAVAK